MNNNRKVNNGIVLISIVSVLALIYLICQFLSIYPRFQFPFGFRIEPYNPFNLGYISGFTFYEILAIIGNILIMFLPISLVASAAYYYYKKKTLLFYIPIVLQFIWVLLVVLQNVNFFLFYGFKGFYFFKIIFSIVLQLLLITLLFIGLYKSRHLKGKIFIYLAIIPAVVTFINNAYYLFKIIGDFSLININPLIANAAFIGSYIMIVYIIEYDIRMNNLSTSPVTNTFTPSYNVPTQPRPTQRPTNSLEHIQILKELASLKDQGIITEEEFESKKRDLLDKI